MSDSGKINEMTRIIAGTLVKREPIGLPHIVGGSPKFQIFGMNAISARISLWKSRYLGAMVDGMREWAALIQREMRANATWQDRTGNARAALVAYVNVDAPGDRPEFADVENPVIKLDKDEYAVIVAGLMHYSGFLEVRWGGKFAILWPTVIENAKDFTAILWAHGKRVT